MVQLWQYLSQPPDSFEPCCGWFRETAAVLGAGSGSRDTVWRRNQTQTRRLCAFRGGAVSHTDTLRARAVIRSDDAVVASDRCSMA